MYMYTACVRSFYDKDAPIYTMSRFLPPSKITNSTISRSILGDGCVVRSGCTLDHSVIGLRALINEGCTIQDSLIMGADYFESLEECALIPGCLPMGIGELALLSASLDRTCPDGLADT
jgi:glucose-1-phosphate adenylyltransferase